jgi:hypothetical protein
MPEQHWQPATSKPGELYTAEGEIKMTGALARGLWNATPRHRELRRPMIRAGQWLLLAAAAVIVLSAVL